MAGSPRHAYRGYRRRAGPKPSSQTPASSSGPESSRDDIRQCKDDGEINVPVRDGLLSLEDVAGDFGLAVAGKLEGRQFYDQITVFDSTGIALQDSATVPMEYERALAAGVGIEKKMIST